MTNKMTCTCCSQRTPLLHGFCDTCWSSGCFRDADGKVRSELCPVTLAGPTVVMCLQCDKPLHQSEPITFFDNSDPGRGGCHVRCLVAYHRKGTTVRVWCEPARGLRLKGHSREVSCNSDIDKLKILARRGFTFRVAGVSQSHETIAVTVRKGSEHGK